ncbi:MAG: hypothetical protein H7070_08355, partial [Saprospiraceae bacterium]|nr:hypothetical protein [Pyrinomonadaceae bacterium]
MKLKLFLFAFAAISSLFSLSVSAQTYAITNAKIVTVSGETIEKGTVVIRNGLIEAVGASARTPADAQVFDGTGLTVYPGFFDALTNLGALNHPISISGNLEIRVNSLLSNCAAQAICDYLDNP